MMGGGGSPGGTNAGLFLPPNQGPAAQGFQDLTTPLYNQGMNAFNMMGGTSPAQTAWPNVYESTQNILKNPYLGDAVSGGVMARDIFQNQMYPQAMGSGGALNYLGALMSQQAGGIPGMMNDPAYAQAGRFGQQLSPQLAGMIPQALNYGVNAANQLSGSAGNILNTAFDPQQQLYNRTAQQIRDQQNAINAQSGVATTPYGAGIAGQRMQDFNIDWQNQQLQRQAAGLGAAGTAYGQGGNTLAQGGQLAGLMGNQAMQAMMAGPNAQLAAQGAGTNILDALTRGTGAGLQGAQNMYSGLAQAAPGMMGASYNAFNQPQQANMAALQNMIQLGNMMYGPGEKATGNLGQYMGLGQSASRLANEIGSTNFNQASQLGSGLMQGLGGLGSSNLLFGSKGLSGALGLGEGGLLGGLFGGGGAAVPFGLDALGLGGATGAEVFGSIAAAPELAAAAFI
jgi:hypothetical protein